jgi:hypothetical protein
MIEMSAVLIEVCGIHAGDGYMRDDGQRREIDISGNVDETDYYIKHVCPIFEKVFNTKINPKLFLSRNTFGFVLRGKRFTDFLHSLGFSYGNKTKTVSVPSTILASKNNQIYAAFLRWLLDTDGHIGFRRYYGKKYKIFNTTHNVYSFISIASVSKRLYEDVKTILDLLGFLYNSSYYKPKKDNYSPVYKLTINGTYYMEKWMNEIGSKNPSKFSRYLIWKKFGFCPTNITYGELDPYKLAS